MQNFVTFCMINWQIFDIKTWSLKVLLNERSTKFHNFPILGAFFAHFRWLFVNCELYSREDFVAQKQRLGKGGEHGANGSGQCDKNFVGFCNEILRGVDVPCSALHGHLLGWDPVGTGMGGMNWWSLLVASWKTNNMTWGQLFWLIPRKTIKKINFKINKFLV